VGVVDKRQAVCLPLAHTGAEGTSLGPPFYGRGGWLMVTYSDSIQLGLLIVAIIGLVLKIIEMDRNHRQ